MSIQRPMANSATATMPSSHQWFPVAATARKVSTRCTMPSHRHRLVDTDTIPRPTTAAHPTWIDGMAANWSDTPVPTGP